MQCGICCENYNKSTNAKVICEISGCGFESCKTCIRTYLLGTTNDPHCMNCKNPWTSKFLVDNLNKTYIDNDYKKHRKNLLVEREISRTPELMNLVERTKLLEEEEKELTLMVQEYNKLRKALNEIHKNVAEKRLKIYRIKNGEDAGKDDRKKFIMPCSGENCKGYLSTQYKCGLCELYTCPDCFEIIGYSKEDPHECKEDNIKSAEMIKKETKGCPKCGVRIFKISGCDQMWCTECKVAFSWNTGKIVINGAIHNPHYYQYMQQNGMGGHGNGGPAPRNPGDVLCGGLITYTEYRHMPTFLLSFVTNYNKITDSELIENYHLLNNDEKIAPFLNDLFEKNKIKSNIKSESNEGKSIETFDFNTCLTNVLSELHRVINHITNVEVDVCRRKVREYVNFDPLTVQYILNKKTKSELATMIFKNDNMRKKSLDLLNIYELLSIVGIERFNALYNYYINNCYKYKARVSLKDSNKKYLDARNACYLEFVRQIIDFITEYNQLLDYCKNQLIQISYTYGMNVNYIGGYKYFTYIICKKKFTQQDSKQSKINEMKKNASSSKELTGSGSNNSEASCSY